MLRNLLPDGPRPHDDTWWTNFQALLDEQNEWPSPYVFKFIVPADHLDALKQVFGDHPVSVRASRRGNYMSVTARIDMDSSDAVLEIYRAASDIEGVIAL